MNEVEDRPDETAGAVGRGVLVIVVVGIALGLGYNQLLLASGPKHGLAWVKQETKLASLEDLPPATADTATSTLTPTPAATTTEPAPATTTAPPAHAPSATPARTTSAPASHAATGATAKSAPPPQPAPPAATSSSPPATSSAPTAAPATHVALPVIPETREPLEVQYATIKKFWDANAAVFVDARSKEEYAEGHIPGAFSLPFDDVFADPDKAKTFDSGGKPIITYCGGGDCELSKSLATALIDGGHKKVLVFMGGMPGWKDPGNPVATGASPGAVSSGSVTP